jgi:hypothetical protein
MQFNVFQGETAVILDRTFISEYLLGSSRYLRRS